MSLYLILICGFIGLCHGVQYQISADQQTVGIGQPLPLTITVHLTNPTTPDTDVYVRLSQSGPGFNTIFQYKSTSGCVFWAPYSTSGTVIECDPQNSRYVIQFHPITAAFIGTYSISAPSETPNRSDLQGVTAIVQQGVTYQISTNPVKATIGQPLTITAQLVNPTVADTPLSIRLKQSGPGFNTVFQYTTSGCALWVPYSTSGTIEECDPTNSRYVIKFASVTAEHIGTYEITAYDQKPPRSDIQGVSANVLTYKISAVPQQVSLGQTLTITAELVEPNTPIGTVTIRVRQGPYSFKTVFQGTASGCAFWYPYSGSGSNVVNCDHANGRFVIEFESVTAAHIGTYEITAYSSQTPVRSDLQGVDAAVELA